MLTCFLQAATRSGAGRVVAGEWFAGEMYFRIDALGCKYHDLVQNERNTSEMQAEDRSLLTWNGIGSPANLPHSDLGRG
jgi:hypothetical protein